MLQHQTHKHHQILIALFIRTKCFLFKGHQTYFCLTFIFVFLFWFFLCVFFRDDLCLEKKNNTIRIQCFTKNCLSVFHSVHSEHKCFLFSWSQIWITHLSWAWGRNTVCMMSWLITRNQMPCSQELCAWKQAPGLEE